MAKNDKNIKEKIESLAEIKPLNTNWDKNITWTKLEKQLNSKGKQRKLTPIPYRLLVAASIIFCLAFVDYLNLYFSEYKIKNEISHSSKKKGNKTIVQNKRHKKDKATITKDKEAKVSQKVNDLVLEKGLSKDDNSNNKIEENKIENLVKNKDKTILKPKQDTSKTLIAFEKKTKQIKKQITKEKVKIQLVVSDKARKKKGILAFVLGKPKNKINQRVKKKKIKHRKFRVQTKSNLAENTTFSNEPESLVRLKFKIK